MLAQVRAAIDYNARVEPEERFAGIHHDNEPYLLAGFAGEAREELLVHQLELAEACQRLLEEAGSDLAFGVDIPFWYDNVSVTWQGIYKPMSDHLFDIVDNVGIMAYRTSTSGADGVLALARDEVAYASQRGKQVYVALETTPLPDQVQYTFAGHAPAPPERQAGARGAYLLAQPWGGLAVLYWNDFDQPGAARLGPELLAAGASYRVFRSVRKIPIPAAKITFASATRAALDAAVEAVLREFRGQAGFAGVAIHDYRGYQALVGEQRADESAR
jgi:hypothetical protein